MRKILLIGHPNVGKTTLFNRLSGRHARTGNYSGTTVDKRSAKIDYQETVIELIDLPGIRKLSNKNIAASIDKKSHLAQDEAIAESSLLRAAADSVCVICADATQLSFQEGLIDQVLSLGHQTALVLTLKDLVESPQTPAEIRSRLEQHYGIPVFWGDEVTVADLIHAFEKSPMRSIEQNPYPNPPRYLPLVDASGQQLLNIQNRSRIFSDRVDRWALHPIFGYLLLLGVFLILFSGLFYLADPFISLLEGVIEKAAVFVSDMVGTDMPIVRSFIADGLISGIGNVLVFLPQIVILFLLLGLLEDSGYLARASALLDRFLQPVGLSGLSFIPYVSGFACAVPAIISARTIQNQQSRLLTILTVPFISCSARLPIYFVMLAAFFSGLPKVGGIVPVSAVILIFLYILSLATAMTVAFLLKTFVLRFTPPPLVMELPVYRRPGLKAVFQLAKIRSLQFLKDAGGMIFLATIVLWALFTFPQPPIESQPTSIVHTQLVHDQASYAEQMGRYLEPWVEPMGFNWQMGVGIIGSFAAREVFISSMALAYGIDEEESSLRDQLIRAYQDPDDPIRPLTGLAAMVFFLFSMQCVSTLAVIRRETGSGALAAGYFVALTILAYGMTALVYQTGVALGY